MTRLIVLFVILVFSFTLSGCQTIKCASEGAATGAQKGAKKDWQDTCTGVKAADTWVNKNLW